MRRNLSFQNRRRRNTAGGRMSCQSRRKLVNQRIQRPSSLPISVELRTESGFKAFHQLGKTITTLRVTPRPESASAAPAKNTVKIVRLAAPPIYTEAKVLSAGGMAFHLLREPLLSEKPQGFFFRLKAFNDRETGSISLPALPEKAPFASDTPFSCAGRCPPASRGAKREKGGRQSRCGQKRTVKRHQAQNTNQHEHIGRKG